MEYFLPKKKLIFLCVLLNTLAIAAFSQWTPQAGALKKRSETTSVVYNEKIYTFLGFSDNKLNVENTAEVYDPATDSWTLLASLPEEKVVTHQGVVLIDGKVWHIGGRVGQAPGPVTSETWIYDIAADTWLEGPQILDPITKTPLRWGGGGAALLGRTLHLFGGFVNSSCRSDQSKYHLTLDVDAWLANPSAPAPWKNERAALPVARNHFGTVVLGGKIYALGGQFGHDCGGGKDTTFSHVYDPVADAWTELTPLPEPRSHFEGSVFAMDGKIYIFAGQSRDGDNTNRVTVFDPAANGGAGSWADDEDLKLPKKFEGLSAKVINNTIFITHGGEGSSYNTRNTAYSKTITRSPVYQLGFPAPCASITVNKEAAATASTLLFTIDGATDYVVSSSAPWLSITKNEKGSVNANGADISFSVNAAGLAPGNYSATITANSVEAAYTAATYCVNLTVKDLPEISATSELVFSGIRGRRSAARYVTISNSGMEPLLISAISINGANDGAFELFNPPALPFNVAPGESYALGVQFTPSLFHNTGALSATLHITSDDADEANVPVGLYGLSTKGEQGNNEPPLNDIVKTLGYDINVGGTKLILSTGPDAIGDEVLTPLFKKAGSGPVTMKPVARYSPDDLLAYGYYVKNGGLPLITEIGKIALNQEQTLHPAVVAGSAISFEPADTVFGFFTGATSYAGQNTYTEDGLNTGPLPHSARIYPLKDRSGAPVANSYLVAFEPAANGDYQDYVFEVTNVAPAGNRNNTGRLEAEEATLSGTVVSSNRAGYSGSGFADYVAESGDYVEWTVTKETAGAAILLFRYANGVATDRPLQLQVNGTVIKAAFSFSPTGAWTTWINVSDTVMLAAGENKIRLTSAGFSGPNIDYLLVREYTAPLPESASTLEAEDALLAGPIVDTKHKGFTGTGFADFVRLFDNYAEWTVTKTASGPVTLSFRYANGSPLGSRAMKLEINGVEIDPALTFPVTGRWTDWDSVSISANLLAGENKIRLTAIGQSGPNMDHLYWADNTAASVQIGRTQQRKVAAPGFSISILPNPAASNANLYISGASILPADITIADMAGKIYKRLSVKGESLNYISLPVQDLAPGIYLVSVQQGSNRSSVKLVVQ